MTKSYAWDVFLDRKNIDTVFSTETDAAAMKRSLVNHDGYDENIVVRKQRKARKPTPRKTRDEWEVQGNYGQGWEMVTTESTFKEARAQRRVYDENEPQYAHRVKLVRVRIDPADKAKADADYYNARRNTGAIVPSQLKARQFTPPFHITTWFERDRSHVQLLDARDNEVMSWWDDDVHQMAEDGFFTMGKGSAALEGSVIDYAKSMGLI